MAMKRFISIFCILAILHIPSALAVEAIKNGISQQEILCAKKPPRSRLQRAISYMVNTVKDDLGFTNSKPEKTSLKSDIKAGTRLSLYGILLALLASKFINTDDLPPQFEEVEKNGISPGFALLALVIAPLCEELFFTKGLSPFLGQIITPMLFGAAHYDKNPRRFLTNFLGASFANWAHVRYYKRKKNIRVPMISHSLHNAVALACLAAR